MAARVLVLAPEPVGEYMAGPPIRALELARALSARCDVTIAAPAPSDVGDAPMKLLEASFADLEVLVDAAREHDVIVGHLFPRQLWTHLRRLDIRVVADMYNPTVMEVLEAGRDRPAGQRRSQQRVVNLIALSQLAGADFVICASEQQRDLWLGGMALNNLLDLQTYERDRSLRSVIDVVPFGLPAEPPSGERALRRRFDAIGEGDKVLLWGGGIWNWLDPFTPIQAVERLGHGVHLVFMGVKRPNVEPRDEMSAIGEAIAYAEERGLAGSRVHFNDGWVPYGERAGWLLDADVGVSAHHDHLEARFSYRTRVLDCIWAGLPIVCTHGDAMSDLVESRGLGRTVPFENADAFAAACSALIESGEPARAAAAELATELSWGQVARPLVEYCADPERGRRRKSRSTIGWAIMRQYPRLVPEIYRRGGLGELAQRASRTVRRRLRTRP